MELQDLKLGLGVAPEPVFLFIGSDHGGGWYQYDFDANKAIPVAETALTGYIRELKITMKEFEGRQNPKLDIYVQADLPYVIRTGLETTFARGILLALRTLTDLTIPLVIAVKPGDKKVVFASLYKALTGERVHAEWDSKVELFPVITDLQVRYGHEVQTELPEAAAPRERAQEFSSAPASQPAQAPPHMPASPTGEKADQADIVKLMRKAGEKKVSDALGFVNSVGERPIAKLSDMTKTEVVSAINYMELL